MSPDSFVLAHAANADWRIALDHCLHEVKAAIGRRAKSAPVTLGWCYLSDYFAQDANAILAELQQHLPGVSWVGTCGIGVAANDTEYFDAPALVLMLAPLARESFQLYSGRQPLPAKSSGFIPHTALVHAEGNTPDVQELLQELAGRTSTGYLFGGLSSGRQQTLHFADDVFTGGLSGVAFGPEIGVISRVTQGCQPFGPIRTVTRAERNFVITLDDRPALECLFDDIGLGDDLADQSVRNALSETLVGLSTGMLDAAAKPGQFGPDTLVRHLIGLDPTNQVVAIADEVQTGMQLSFCSRDPQAALADVERIASEIRSELESGTPRDIAGALYVSCSGRGGPHFGTPHAEFRALNTALGDVPLAGFFAGGEIARDHLYGYTGVLTVFTTPR